MEQEKASKVVEEEDAEEKVNEFSKHDEMQINHGKDVDHQKSQQFGPEVADFEINPEHHIDDFKNPPIKPPQMPSSNNNELLINQNYDPKCNFH